MTATDTASSTSTGGTSQSVESAVTDLIRVFKRPAVQRRLMEDAGVAIEFGAYWALGRVAALGPCRPSELAASLGVDASTITHRIQALERSGLVERSTDPTDGRACNVHLSEAGTGALTRLREARRALFDQLLEGWSPDEQSRFAAAAERLRIALEREIREP